jgi:hypothetical protein
MEQLALSQASPAEVRATIALRTFDRVFGFLVPLPLFIQVQNGIGVYSGGFVSEGLSVPIAYLVAPLALISALRIFLRARPLPVTATIGAFITFVWILALGSKSSLQDPRAVLYMVQWAAPFTMLVYGAMLAYDDERRANFIKGFLPATIASIVYLIAIGTYEFLFMSTFQGRMTQNAIFPGMYQLYNYVPLGMVMCGMFATGVVITRKTTASNVFPLVLMLITLGVPLLTAARGSVALYAVCAPLLGWRMFGLRGALWVLALPLAILVLFASDSFLLLEKLSALQEQTEYGGTFGNRDEMGALYWQVYMEDPILGTQFLPPILAFPHLGIDVKSAHNYYLDSLAWGGPIALSGILMLLWSVLVTSFQLIRRFLLSEGAVMTRPAALALSALPTALGIMLVNSNLRIPLREPYTGVIGFMLIGILLASGQRALSSASSSPSS